jgi:Holliday junction resolvase RusA-like endonuclease
VTTISFTVLGVPQTAGSKKTIPIKNRATGEWVTRDNGSTLTVTVDDNPKAKNWKSAVAWEARKVYTGPLLTGPLHVAFTFVMPRAQGHYRTGKNSGQLKPGAPRFPITRPDALKMARCAEDSLSNVIYRDDSQIVSEMLLKRYAEGGPARLEVSITQLDGAAK